MYNVTAPHYQGRSCHKVAAVLHIVYYPLHHHNTHITICSSVLTSATMPSILKQCFGSSIKTTETRTASSYAGSACDSQHSGASQATEGTKSSFQKSISNLFASAPSSPRRTPYNSLQPGCMDLDPTPSMEPVLERTSSQLVGPAALLEQCMRVASPKDQEQLEQVHGPDLRHLAVIGEGGYGNVNLCAVAARISGPAEAAVRSTAAGERGSNFGGDQVPCSSKAVHEELVVVVKTVQSGFNQERELMQLHRCQSCPFIVRLFGFVDDGGDTCQYIMEWAEGGDLATLLKSLKDRRRTGNAARLLMSEASARYYTACLLLSLQFLHGNGLLHRDIKPENILLMSDGTAKLCDLGFTVAMDIKGLAVGCCGTPGFIAPEVWSYGTSKSRLGYGVTADLWSTGAFIYDLLTGTTPTVKPDDCLKKGWAPALHPHFSPELRDLLRRLLSIKPSHRLQDVAQVMAHPWFASFDFQALRNGSASAPFIPAERRKAKKHLSTTYCTNDIPAAVSSVNGDVISAPLQPPQHTLGKADGEVQLQGQGCLAHTSNMCRNSELVPQRSAISAMMNEGSMRGSRREGRACMSMDDGGEAISREVGDVDHAVVAGCA